MRFLKVILAPAHNRVGAIVLFPVYVSPCFVIERLSVSRSVNGVLFRLRHSLDNANQKESIVQAPVRLFFIEGYS